MIKKKLKELENLANNILSEKEIKEISSQSLMQTKGSSNLASKIDINSFYETYYYNLKIAIDKKSPQLFNINKNIFKVKNSKNILTDEQKEIIQSTEDNLKINAVAGSGKTTTLIEYAKSRPKESFLYLAYNKSIANDINKKAIKNKINNITVSTIHSLAYRNANGFSYELDNLNELKIQDNYLIAKEKNLKLAWLINDIITYYLNSWLIKLDEVLLEEYLKSVDLTMELQELVNKKSVLILSKIKEILGDMKNRKFPATHDFYLKMYQFMKPKLNYDSILVDEAQDISQVMMKIINSQNSKKIYVGDSFQQIYSFRFATNSLDLIDFPKLSLTKSFRFGQNLAKEIEFDINRMYKKLLKKRIKFKLNGVSDRDTIFSRVRANFNQKTVIARSNLKLFESVVKHLDFPNLKFSFESEYKSYGFMNIKVISLIYLYKNAHDKIRDDFIKRFKSFNELAKFAEEIKNRELLLYIKLVKDYQGDLFDINRLIKEKLISKNEADITFSTTHKAKGSEYENVEMLDDDFIKLEELKKSSSDISKLKEEINIYYVASTRAKNRIKLPLI